MQDWTCPWTRPRSAWACGRDDRKGAASAPESLHDTLTRLDLSLARVGMEACSLSTWLHDGPAAAGWPAICIETRRANAAMQTKPSKTDRNEARALAQIMRTGWSRRVDVKSRQSRR